MTDGTGSTSYAYNGLSQITAETKSFTGLSNSFTINYTYNLSGGVKSITDPQNVNRQVNYSFDKIGRTFGANMVSQSTTVGNVFDTKFRAWGALKEYQYNLNGGTNPTFMKYYFDAAMQISRYETGTASAGVSESVDYRRLADGKPKSAINNQNHKFDRSFDYGIAGSLIKAKAGYAANHDPNLTIQDSPYEQDLSYSVFGETGGIQGKYWYHAVPYYSIGLYPQTKDPAGNVVLERIQNSPTQLDRTYKWDAAGRQVQVTDPPIHGWEVYRNTETAYDGDGRMVKSARSLSGQNPITVFDIRSTVIGGASVGKLTDNGNGTTVQEFSAPANGGELKYYTTIALNFAAFDWTAPEGIKKSDVELDARGADVETTNPYDNGGDGGASYPEHPDSTNYMRCADNGAPISCSLQDKLDAWDPLRGRKNPRGPDPLDAWAREHMRESENRTALAYLTSGQKVHHPGSYDYPDWVDNFVDASESGGTGMFNNAANLGRIGNSKLCDKLAKQLDQFAQFFEEVWTESGSGTKDPREKGGLIGFDYSGRVVGQGNPKENPVEKKFTGQTYSDSMGPDFTKWVLREIDSAGANNFAILFIVHTHPVSGRPYPSEKTLQNGEKIGDRPTAKGTGFDGIVVTRSKLGVYNGEIRYCEFDRTPTSVSPVSRTR